MQTEAVSPPSIHMTRRVNVSLLQQFISQLLIWWKSFSKSPKSFRAGYFHSFWTAASRSCRLCSEGSWSFTTVSLPLTRISCLCVIFSRTTWNGLNGKASKFTYRNCLRKQKTHLCHECLKFSARKKKKEYRQTEISQLCSGYTSFFFKYLQLSKCTHSGDVSVEKRGLRFYSVQHFACCGCF